MPSKKESTKVKTQDRAIFFIIASAILLTPLIYFKETNELFEFPKMMFAYFIVTTAGLFYALKRLLKPSDKPKSDNNSKSLFEKFSILEKGVYSFLIANFVSAVFSILPYTSVFGYYTRFNGGLLSIALWSLLFFIITRTNLERLTEKLRSVALFSLVPVSIYAIYQRLGFEKDLWIEDSQTRVFSSLGQPNWLAAFLVILIPLSIKRVLDEEKTNAKIMYSVLSLLALSALWFTFSFSGFLGILGALIFFIIFTEKALLLKNRIYLFSITGIMLLIMVGNPGVFGPKLNDSINDVKNKFFPAESKTELIVESKPPAEQQTEEVKQPEASKESKPQEVTSKPKFGDTTGIRLTVWKGSFNLFNSSLKNALIGTGPETFPYAFLKFRPKEMNLTSEWDFVFNKPHNYYIELLCNLGLLGFSTYVFLIKGIFRDLRNSSTLALKAGIFGLFVTDAFGWHTVMASMLLYVFLAIIHKEEYETK